MAFYGPRAAFFVPPARSSLLLGYYHRSCVPDNRWLAGGSGSRKGDRCQVRYIYHALSDHDFRIANDTVFVNYIFESTPQWESSTPTVLHFIKYLMFFMKLSIIYFRQKCRKTNAFVLYASFIKLPVIFLLPGNLMKDGGCLMSFIFLFWTWSRPVCCVYSVFLSSELLY